MRPNADIRARAWRGRPSENEQHLWTPKCLRQGGQVSQTMTWPLLVYFVLVVLLVAGMLAASYVLGQRRHDRAMATPFESGVLPAGTARVRLSVKFYLIAMFFVVFDIEAIFIFTWCVVAREAGWAGFWEIVVFVAVLAAALMYLWRIRALDWESIPHNL
jgi:NADH-quinone oxidoreductase subunit A